MRPKQTKHPSAQSKKPRHAASQYVIERVQTGVRMEKRLLKVLKALAEYHDLSLGDLIEGIVLHAFDGKLPFDEASRKTIAEFKRIYHLNLDSRASHKLQEGTDTPEKERAL